MNAKLKITKAEQNMEVLQKEFETRWLKIQEELHQWKQVSCTAFHSLLPSLDWQNKLVVSSMLLEYSNVFAPVIVRITDVSQKMKNNETFTSPPFYTHYFGYRVCLQVILNGVNNCKDTHVSVVICILSGPNDDKLRWPLKGQFTVTLLNQIKNSTHCFQVLEVNADRINMESSDSTIRNMSKGFVPHNKLFTASSFCAYCVSDVMYIQVQYIDKK